MNRIATFVVENARLAWTLALAAIAATAFLAGELTIDYRQREQLSRLHTATERFGNEIMSYTLDGSLMGAISMLGLTDADIKHEAQGGDALSPKLINLLGTVGRSYDSEGVFVVGRNGIIKSSWDSNGKPSTGLNVKFRPYFQMALQGTENIYAAVSLARGDRALYFTAPVYAENSSSSARTGAVVARTNLSRIDELLKNKSDIALLLSPQGVVFASNRPEWIGFLVDTPSPERINKIRELKQFGNMFENKDPSVLPISSHDDIQSLEGSRFAVAVTRVLWNDPSGDWKLVLMEDLSRTIPMNEIVSISALVGGLTLLISLLILFVLHGKYRQAIASRELQLYAAAQAASAAQKNQLAAASMRMQQADSAHELGQIFLGETHRMLGIFQGVIYAFARDGDSAMECVASYACHSDLPLEISAGEGLLGQCAIDRQRLMIEAPDEAFWKIRSGLGETSPLMVLIEPIMLNDIFIGVTELSAPKALDEAQQNCLSELIPILAMNLEILRRKRTTEAQLTATVNTISERESTKSAERFNRLSLDYEQRVMQLKKEVNEMAKAAGQEPPYASILIETAGDHQLEPSQPEKHRENHGLEHEA
ncbi:MAG: C4-dicarboxylate transporter [Betaproteobacteria bacterium]